MKPPSWMKSEQLHRPIKLLRPTNWFFSLRQNNITDWNNSGVHSFLRFTQFRCFLELQHMCVLFYIAIRIQIIRGVTRIFKKGRVTLCQTEGTHHALIISFNVTKKAYKGGSQAPQNPPLATPLSILVTNLKGWLYLWNALD